MTPYAYGWLRQKPDHRDHEFLPTVPRQAVPPTFALDVSKIPVLDQGQQGSCTGHGPSGLVMHDQQAQGEPVVVPARAMIYYDARKLEGTTGQDVGAEVRDAVKGIANWGVCPDSEFPYSDQVYDKAPSKQDYADASKQEAIVYQAVNYPHLNQTLASGFPFVFGFTVYESFEGEEVARTGVVPMPGPGERVVGGHCVWAWGYNDQRTGSFQGIPPRSKACRNSWGEGWGDHGNFYLPQGYFDAGLCSDFWIIKRLGAK